MTILVLGSAVAREGHLPELLAASQAHVARSRAEPGCVRHAVHVDTENAQRLVFVEEWASLEALQAHFAVPASREFGKTVARLSAAAPTLEIFEATAVRR